MTPRYPSIARPSGLFLSCPLSFFPYFILLPNILSPCFLPLLSYLLFTCAGMITRSSHVHEFLVSLKHTKCSFFFRRCLEHLFCGYGGLKKSLNNNNMLYLFNRLYDFYFLWFLSTNLSIDIVTSLLASP